MDNYGIVHHIFGPPGCGKTTHLQRRIEATIRARGEDSVLCMSYTRAAARETESRMRGEGKGKTREKNGKQKRVGTMHSLLYDALGYPSIAELHLDGWNSTQADQRRLSGKRDMDDFDVPRGKTRGDEWMTMAQLYRARMVPLELWRPDVRAYYRDWCAWCDREGHVDFTGFIETAIRRSIPPPDGCSVGIFDEAQDFSKLEISLIRQWSECLDASVFAYDDDQTLFTWRGADPTALLDLMPAPPERCKVLDQSYRVPRAVHAVAQAWIEKCSRRISKEYKPRPEDGRVRRVRGCTYHRPEAVLDLVSEDLAAGGNSMILASCGYMLAPTLAVLRKRGVPFANPYRKENGAWNPLTVGATARRILSFSQRNPEFWGDTAFMHLWTHEQLADWTKHLGAGCFCERGKKQELLDIAADKERKKEIAKDSYFLSPECLAWVDRGDLAAFEAAVLGNQRTKYEFPLAIARRDIRLLDTEKNPPRVIVGTVHSVKGGESSHVYLYPDLSYAGYDQWQKAATRDDVRRVFYVAMTRARETLTILGPGSNLAVEGM